MVIVVFFYDDRSRREGLLDHLASKFPDIVSLMYIINQKKNDSLTDQAPVLYKGLDHLTEVIDGLKFRIGPKSFFQTNTRQAAVLYRTAKSFAGLTGSEIVYDLYTGAGTIACYVADLAKKVIGIEYVEEAVEDAKSNAENNCITNTSFFAGDIKNVMDETFISKHGKPDVVITDPPRAGMAEDVIKTIIRANPQRIVYISCNPATQARDVSLLAGQYRVTKIQPFDMFPQTHHVENAVLLERI
jgi:23S rRNA (uracil1939-C5)-methyltransferase